MRHRVRFLGRRRFSRPVLAAPRARIGKGKAFGEIWTNTEDPLLNGLRDRHCLLKGRCGRCSWKEVCNGNFRVRAEAVHSDVWAEDPACYLTEEEIAPQ